MLPVHLSPQGEQPGFWGTRMPAARSGRGCAACLPGKLVGRTPASQDDASANPKSRDSWRGQNARTRNRDKRRRPAARTSTPSTDMAPARRPPSPKCHRCSDRPGLSPPWPPRHAGLTVGSFPRPERRRRVLLVDARWCGGCVGQLIKAPRDMLTQVGTQESCRNCARARDGGGMGRACDATRPPTESPHHRAAACRLRRTRRHDIATKRGTATLRSLSTAALFSERRRQDSPPKAFARPHHRTWRASAHVSHFDGGLGRKSARPDTPQR